MNLTIVLRKVVADVAEAETQTELVNHRLAGFPNVTVTATVSEQIQETA